MCHSISIYGVLRIVTDCYGSSVAPAGAMEDGAPLRGEPAAGGRKDKKKTSFVPGWNIGGYYGAELQPGRDERGSSSKTVIKP